MDELPALKLRANAAFGEQRYDDALALYTKCEALMHTVPNFVLAYYYTVS